MTDLEYKKSTVSVEKKELQNLMYSIKSHQVQARVVRKKWFEKIQQMVYAIYQSIYFI
jgi:hypothetical protein